MALNLKTFITRTITAAVFVAVLLGCIMYSFVSFASLFFIVSIWGLFEFYQLAEKLEAKPYKWVGLLSATLLFGSAIATNTHALVSKNYLFLAGICATFLFFIAALFDSKSGKPILNLVYTLSGLIYVVVPFMLLVYTSCINTTTPYDKLITAPYNFHFVLGPVLLIWASDASAYIVGSLIGKNKLYERISPGKTWEGSIGATLLTVGCSFIIAGWYPEIATIHWIMISIIVCVFGTMGDLVESMLKRQAGVKDSGKIMPGHGGILDRFDSLLFVSPFLYVYLSLAL